MNISFSGSNVAASRPPVIIFVRREELGSDSAATTNFMSHVRNVAPSVMGNVSQSDARLNRLA